MAHATEGGEMSADELADNLTEFMNRSTFSADEIREYPYDKRKSYTVDIKGDQTPFDFYATDDAAALRYLSRIFVPGVTFNLTERIITFRKVRTVKPVKAKA